jgi:hypothetical protein
MRQPTKIYSSSLWGGIRYWATPHIQSMSEVILQIRSHLSEFLYLSPSLGISDWVQERHLKHILTSFLVCSNDSLMAVLQYILVGWATSIILEVIATWAYCAEMIRKDEKHWDSGPVYYIWRVRQGPSFYQQTICERPYIGRFPCRYNPLNSPTFRIIATYAGRYSLLLFLS